MDRVKIDVRGQFKRGMVYLVSLGYTKRKMSAPDKDVGFLFGDSVGQISFAENDDLDFFNKHSYKQINFIGEAKMSNTDTKWMFHVNAEYQIDFPRIAEDLTADHPVALVRTPEHTYCVVRDKLAAKMHYSEGNGDKQVELIRITKKEGIMPNGVVYELDHSKIGPFLKFWKEVQTSRHGKKYRGKREVTVSLQSL